LIIYLGSRRVNLKNDKQRQRHNIEKLVQLCRSIDLKASLPAKHIDVGHHYLSYDQLVCSQVNSGWISDISCVIFQYIRKHLSNIDEKFIDTEFSNGRNGIRTRALRSVQSGQFDLSTMRITTAMLRDDKQQVTVIKILCTPSMKSDSYWGYLIYKKSDTGERDTLLKTPLSRCDCPAGRFFLQSYARVLAAS